jgi:hypothetical protein
MTRILMNCDVARWKSFDINRFVFICSENLKRDCPRPYHLHSRPVADREQRSFLGPLLPPAIYAMGLIASP